MEIDCEIFSMVILFSLIQEGLLSATNISICTEYWLTAWSKLAQEKSVVRSTDHPGMTIASDLDGKPHTKQCKYGSCCKKTLFCCMLTTKVWYTSVLPNNRTLELGSILLIKYKQIHISNMIPRL